MSSARVPQFCHPRMAVLAVGILLVTACSAGDGPAEPADAVGSAAADESGKPTGQRSSRADAAEVASSGPDVDTFGGYGAVAVEPTGRFRVEQIDGRWWFVTPEGHPFWSHGVQGVSSAGTIAADGSRPYERNIVELHGSVSGWAQSVLKLMNRAGLNTLGDFSEIEHFRDTMPYVTSIYASHHAPQIERGPDAFRGRAHDFFDPKFEVGVNDDRSTVTACGEDPYCIGVFLDDEISWAASFLMSIPYLDSYLYLDAGAPGKREVQRFLEDRYDTVEELNAVWNSDLGSFADIHLIDPESDPFGSDPATAPGGQQSDRTDFRALVETRYFSVTGSAFSEAASDVLNLCSRFLPGNLTPDVVAIAAEYCDVISINAFDVPVEAIRMTTVAASIYGHANAN